MSATAAHPQKRRRCHHGLAAHVVLCSLALAACGESAAGGGSVGATTATGYSSPIGLSRCMRSHGLPRFPDPVSGPGGEGFNGLVHTAEGTLVVNGITFAGPALKRAEQACSPYLTPSGPPPAIPARVRRAMVARARCMRRNGVPGFPDPSFGPNAGANQGTDVHPQSPAFKHAASICGAGGFSVGG